jgi:hypothetical protein
MIESAQLVICAYHHCACSRITLAEIRCTQLMSERTFINSLSALEDRPDAQNQANPGEGSSGKTVAEVVNIVAAACLVETLELYWEI